MSVPPPQPVPSPPCPNCGMPWPPEAPVCPNCGYVRPEIPSWPPPPGGQPGLSAVPLPAKLVTGSAAGDILLGVGVSLASLFVGIGIIAMPILYFALRRPYPVLARGLGFGWLVGAAVALGILAICIVGISHSSQNGQ